MKSKSILKAIPSLLAVLFSGCAILPYPTGGMSLTSETNIDDPELLLLIEKTIVGYMSENNLPGMQIALKTGENSLYYRGIFGHQDSRRESELSNQNLFRVGSVTKTFTGVVIMKLIEEQKISLDDRLEQWVQGISNGSDITIRHMLNHTSGIPNSLFGVDFMWHLPFSPRKHWSSEEIITIFRRKGSDFNPGTRFAYSNANYILLSYIAEKVTGDTMGNLIDEMIAIPCELSQTCYTGEGVPEQLGGLIDGYDRSYLPSLGYYTHRNEMDFWNTLEKGAGALVSTAADLLRFAESLEGGVLLQEETIEEMKETVPYPIEGLVASTYGLGLAGYEWPDQIYYGHAGIDIGFSAFFCFSEDHQNRYAVVTNASALDMDAFIADLHLAVLSYGRN